jgi:hypothetical protein
MGNLNNMEVYTTMDRGAEEMARGMNDSEMHSETSGHFFQNPTSIEQRRKDFRVLSAC